MFLRKKSTNNNIYEAGDQSMIPFWNMSVGDTAEALTTDIEKGLTQVEADNRLAAFGKNSIEAKSQSSGLKIFLRQFTSPLIIILLVAVLVTIVISHYRDAVFILISVLVNTVLGFYQENKAEKALASLKTYLKERTRVIRDDKEYEIEAEYLVPGDIVRLSQGDRVPADARIIFTNDLQIDESVLTGESLPVTKVVEVDPLNAVLADQECMAFAGTLVTQGVGTILIVRTGSKTEFGLIADLIAKTENEETPLQKEIREFSLRASALLSALTVLIFIGGLFAGYSLIEMFLTSIAIAVSAIPEGLPVALTVILSIGVQRMAKRKGVVRKLVAAETLGSTTVILTDKTGTLTMAKMELTDVLSLGDLDEQAILQRGLLNASVIIENPMDEPASWRMNGKIMEVALVKGSALRGVDAVKKTDQIIQSIPFNAQNKFSVSLIKAGDTHKLIFFGAPDILIGHSDLDSLEKKTLHEQVDTLASTGKRILSVAHTDINPPADFSLADFLIKNPNFGGVVFDGLLVFHDPVRPYVKEAIEKVEKAGIRTVIMTGDHKGTAQAIAKEIGMKIEPGMTLDAVSLLGMSDDELKLRLPSVRVISRVTPFDKLRIARMYQSLGEVVAMTGDGVNDAPAIKQADVGIAMGSGTEVSRSVADLVLLDDNFETIVAAVEEGRQIMSNIRKVLVYLLSNVADGLILIGGSLLTGMALPLNALQILWVNFFSDSFPAIAFAFEKEEYALSRKPRKPGQGLFDPLMRFLILIIGFISSALLFFLYWILTRYGFNEQLVHTFIFASFGTYTLFVALSVRSLERSIFSYSLWSNRYMVWGILAGFILMLLAIYVPILQSLFDTVSLPLPWFLAVVFLGIANIGLIEFGKWIFRKYKGV